MAERRESLERLLREALGDDAPAVLDPDQRFDELGLDSLDVSEFFLSVESQFDVKFDRDDFSRLVSLAAVDAFLASHTAAA